MGLFDHLHEAEEAAKGLRASGIPVNKIRVWGEYAIEDPRATGSYPTVTGERQPADPTYIRHKLEDMGAERGRRGCTLLTAFVDKDDVHSAMRFLNRHDAIDLDQSMAVWREDIATQ